MLLKLFTSLSEDPNVTVGLLEAGRYVHDMPQINIPGGGHPSIKQHIV